MLATKALTALLALTAATAGDGKVTVEPAPAVSPPSARLPIHIGGRVDVGTGAAGPSYTRQWPGTYFETAFRGTVADFRIGKGGTILKVSVDGADVSHLVDPRPGEYRVSGMAPGAHRLRVDVMAESQRDPTIFGGFFAADGSKPLSAPARPRQIEFIGDSHTVGYGNMSPTVHCTQDEVRATTDTSRGLAALVAARYGADYEVNAISGRGVVRNYNGSAADTVPQVYPFALFDKREPVSDPGWQPQVIVIALGTNDFTTKLHPGEQWADRAALHADFEQTYVSFVERLRRANPRATFVIWATDMAHGEIEAEAANVVARLRASGERRIAFVPVNGLAFGGCHSHPTLADDQRIANAVETAIDAQPAAWTARPARTRS